MDRDGTVAHNIIGAPAMLWENVSAYYERVVDFEPDVVFSDFDSFAYLFAKRHRLPVVSIDNQQIIPRCKHEDFVKAGAKVDYQLTKAFVKAKLPGCDHYIVTTFFTPPIRKKYKDDTTLVPPILRKTVLDAKAKVTTGDHVLVYQTSGSDGRLLPTLNQVSKERFIVYGLRRSEQVGNCTLKDFDESGFIDDLASAKAVVCNGGLSLIGEAVFLGKPIYSVPVRHQFEQLMNARYVEALGYGLSADTVDADVLRLFLRETDRYAARVSRHTQDGNTLLFETIAALMHRLERKARKRKEKHAATSA
jgi:uncharacterized protein (TIGR00661 family)